MSDIDGLLGNTFELGILTLGAGVTLKALGGLVESTSKKQPKKKTQSKRSIGGIKDPKIKPIKIKPPKIDLGRF